MSTPTIHRLGPNEPPLANVLGPLDGVKIPGGCDTCTAYRTFEPVQAGLWVLRVWHDPDCPLPGGIRKPEST